MLLVTLVFACPALLYLSLAKRGNGFAWMEAIFTLLCTVAILGLLRIRIAFALLAAPLLVFSAYTLFTGLILPPEWSALRNPIHVIKVSFEVVLSFGAAKYFWRKFSKPKTEKSE
jgi:hypothetical protein